MTIKPQGAGLQGAWRPAPERGFTLIELMVTITIVAILATLAMPAVTEMLLSARLTADANSFVASAQLARSEAIKRNTTVVMCRSGNGRSCTTAGGWERGWIVFNDVNANGVVDTGEGDAILQTEPALAPGYKFTPTRNNAYSLAFQPTGMVHATGMSTPMTAELTLCRATMPGPGSQERKIMVWPAGRTSVERKTEAVCN